MVLDSRRETSKVMQHSQQDHRGQQQGREQEEAKPPADADEKHGDNGDQGGKPAVAGHKVVGDDGDQPLPGGVDDPAAHDARGVAAEAHAHGQRLFAAGAGTF